MDAEDGGLATRGQVRRSDRLRAIGLRIGQLLAVKVLFELLIAVLGALRRYLDL